MAAAKDAAFFCRGPVIPEDRTAWELAVWLSGSLGGPADKVVALRLRGFGVLESPTFDDKNPALP